jgi:tetratricopeptide (TPR) repeat protein
MPSLVPGFGYDIFISYRQKDNKYDGWVTDFVDHLKRELESTFKEDISVYFDINPHDGLLETHDVNESLKEKLRCLVFIPVISRTYCDDKSFAWEHEFKAFINYAATDRLGLKIKLPNGNVACRVLPMKIYDLDPDDARLCEDILGGPMRGIDFVYREPGINRPLTQDDDDKKNLERTKYRNQINKAGNAIREIISAIRSEPVSPAGEKTIPGEFVRENPRPVKATRSFPPVPGFLSLRSLLIIVTILMLIAVSATAILLLNKRKPGKTIAILFSTDVKGDSTLQYVGDIYAETIHSKIKAIKKISVRPRINMLQYRNSDKPLNVIRKELAVDYLLYGNITRKLNSINLWITLISEGDNKELWSEEYVWELGRISANSTGIVRTIARYMDARLSAAELNLIESNPSPDAAANMNYAYANSLSYTAWSSYAMGNKLVRSVSFASAISTYDRAIENDPKFAEAYARRAITRAWGYYTRQLDSTQITKCREDIDMALQLNSKLHEGMIASGFYYYYCKVDFNKAIEYFNQAFSGNTDDYQPLFYMAMVYRRIGDWTRSQELLRKIIRLNPPLEALEQTNIGISYTFLHSYDSALIFYQKAIDIMPGWPDAWINKMEAMLLKNGKTAETWQIMNDAIKNGCNDFSAYKVKYLMYERNYDGALKQAGLSSKSNFPEEGDRYQYMAMLSKYLGKQSQAASYFDSAMVQYENDLDRDPHNALPHSVIGIIYAATGRRDNALAEAEKAKELFDNNIYNESRDLINIAKIFTLAGEYDQAFSTLEYLLKTPSIFSVQILKLDPAWDPLRNRPEYKRLMAEYISE